MKKTKLQQAYNLFVSNDYLRPVMHNPFEVDGLVAATDAHALIWCEKENIDFKFENEHKPLNIKHLINENTKELINIDSIDWDSLKTTDETEGDGKEIECGNCDGDGVLTDDFKYKGKWYNTEVDCPVCDGTGVEEEEKQIPTGKKTFKDDSVIQVKDVFFDSKLIYKVKQVKDLIGGDVSIVNYVSPVNGVTFQVGFAKVIVMPMTNLSDENEVIAKIPTHD